MCQTDLPNHPSNGPEYPHMLQYCKGFERKVYIRLLLYSQYINEGEILKGGSL